MGGPPSATLRESCSWGRSDVIWRYSQESQVPIERFLKRFKEGVGGVRAEEDVVLF